jgi:hypothetical protein
MAKRTLSWFVLLVLANALPAAARSGPDVASASCVSPDASATLDECYDNCATDQQMCMEANCPGEDSCELCEAEYYSCIHYCYIQNTCGGDPHAVRDTYIDHRYDGFWWFPPDFVCVGDPGTFSGTLYRKAQHTSVLSSVRITTFCDGSRTEEVLSSISYNDSCYYYPTYSYCYPEIWWVPYC